MKIMSIIGIVVATVGIYFGLSFMVAGYSDAEIGMGFITFLISGYFLALSIVGVVKAKKAGAVSQSAEITPSSASSSANPEQPTQS